MFAFTRIHASRTRVLLLPARIFMHWYLSLCGVSADADARGGALWVFLLHFHLMNRGDQVRPVLLGDARTPVHARSPTSLSAYSARARVHPELACTGHHLTPCRTHPCQRQPNLLPRGQIRSRRAVPAHRLPRARSWPTGVSAHNSGAAADRPRTGTSSEYVRNFSTRDTHPTPLFNRRSTLRRLACSACRCRSARRPAYERG
jgi:hypothetical protein